MLHSFVWHTPLPGSPTFTVYPSLKHAISCRDLHGSGMWGVYPDAVVPGLGVVEGGQTSTGSAVAWFRRLVSGGELGVDRCVDIIVAYVQVAYRTEAWCKGV